MIQQEIETEHKKKMILIVDDDADFVYFLSEHLSHFGYSIVSADSGQTAKTIASHYKPDLILSDINMPDGNGLHLLHQVKNLNPKMPFFFITGKHGVRKDSCLNQGALDIIQKPLNLKSLIKTLDNFFNPENYYFSEDEIKKFPVKDYIYFWPSKSPKGNQIMLGVKGLFLPSTMLDPKKDPIIRLNITFEDRQWCPLEFIGKIIWQRKIADGNFLAGTGVEILQFIRGNKWYGNYIEQNKIISTIPIGLSYR